MASYVTHKTPKNKAWLARQHLRPWMWALLGFPRFEGAKSRKDHDYRSRRRKVRFSDSRHRLGRYCPPAWSAQARPSARVLPEAAACLVGIEACASSHHRSRELQAV